MTLVLLAPPATEPLSLAEAKHFLRVEHDVDDDLVSALVAGARGHVEAVTRRALITQTWRLVMNAWPRDGRFSVLMAPLQAVAGARIIDAAGAATELDAAEFTVEPGAAPGAIQIAADVPPPGRVRAGIELDLVAGYGDAAADLPEPLRHAVRLLVAHWYENRGLAAASAAAGKSPAGVEALLAPYRVVTL